MSVHQLRPASPDLGEEPKGFRSRVRWRLILSAFAVLALVVGVLVYRNHAKKQRMLDSLEARHGQNPQKKLSQLIKQIDQHVARAKAGPLRPVASSKFRLSLLRQHPGVYYREGAVSSVASSEEEGRLLTDDAFTACLGVSPVSVHKLKEVSEFVDDEWLEQRTRGANVMKLRVTEDELNRRMKRDLPAVRDAVEARWLLAVINRNTQHEVWMWDLRDDQLLFSQTFKPKGRVLRARYGTPHAGQEPAREADMSRALTDCALASNVKSSLRPPSQ